ncbi:MAG: response regulator [Chloroflexota bacterium]|nr:response regulator [Chloroflexota bacterium]
MLVVDDDRDIVEFLRVALEDEGFRVETAFDGEVAWTAARLRRPDVIVIDLMMPRLDGLGLLGRLRAVQHLAPVPVILMSAVHGGHGPLGVPFLGKPFDVERMLEMVAVALGVH